MKPELINTDDGSHSLYLRQIDEHYHSTFGAVQESMHVFINAGLSTCNAPRLTIFEAGFGTGLNAWLTFLQSLKTGQQIEFITIEKFPLESEIYEGLNYQKKSGADKAIFLKIHQSAWNQKTIITENFTLHKIKGDLTTFDFSGFPEFDLIFFDAFSPEKQPELWDISIFRKLFDQTAQGGRLVTYCAKGSVRRALSQTGFSVERIPGPPGKREMLRASKNEYLKNDNK